MKNQRTICLQHTTLANSFSLMPLWSQITPISNERGYDVEDKNIVRFGAASM